MPVRISSDLLDAIIADADTTEMEICGLLFGTGNAITARQPCRNVALDARIAFEIDPTALIAAHRAARTGGPAIIGCYHSHPSGSAQPSARDAVDAAPDGALWLVVARAGVGLWRSVAKGEWQGRFDPVALIRD